MDMVTEDGVDLTEAGGDPMAVSLAPLMDTFITTTRLHLQGTVMAMAEGVIGVQAAVPSCKKEKERDVGIYKDIYINLINL